MLLYLGANLEIAAGALAFAVHAEQSAVNNALLHGEKGFKAYCYHGGAMWGIVASS